MPRLTIDLTEDAYTLLKERAQDEQCSLDWEAVRLQERSFMTTQPTETVLRGAIRPRLNTIKGFVSTLLMDEDGTMFSHSDRLEFYGILDKECDQLNEALEPGRRNRNGKVTFHARLTRLREVLVAVQDETRSRLVLWELADDLPETLLTDEEALKNILRTFLNAALGYTPPAAAVRVEVRRESASQEMLFFSLTDQGEGIGPELLARLTRELAAPLLNIVYFGGPIFHHERLFVQWHGGTFQLHADGIGKGMTVSFTLRLFSESLEPIGDDPQYYAVLNRLRQICLGLLAGSEQLPNQHHHFDDAARKALAETLREELEALQTQINQISL